jgi:hypothetical protein
MKLGILNYGDQVAQELSQRHAGTFATKVALQGLPAKARCDGQLAFVKADRSLWMFDSASVLTTDAASELVLEPTAGDGAWLRADKAFVAKLPIAFGMADGATIWTIPEGFAIRATGLPYWENTVSWSGGSSSSIGVASSRTGFTAAGAVLGGAAGDVAATLVAGIAAGTVGTGFDSLAEIQAGLFEEGDTFTYEEITSAFTAGSGFVCMPVHIAVAPATP